MPTETNFRNPLDRWTRSSLRSSGEETGLLGKPADRREGSLLGEDQSAMIATLLFIWYLLTVPTDKLICTMWVSTPPSANALTTACGPLDHRELMVWRAVDIQSGKVACERPASELPALNCNLIPLDHYRLEVIWPNYQEIACFLAVTDAGMPSMDTITNQCPQQAAAYAAGNLVLKFIGTRPEDPTPPPACQVKPLETGSGFYDLPSGPDDLQTSKPYALLAQDLIWSGVAKADCDGWSGVDPNTNAVTQCGLDSVMPRVISWQNRFDLAIYQAGVQFQVPPKLLKGLIGVESQFWPLSVGTIGESGLIQLTDVGADISLRYSPTLFDALCPMAVPAQDCSASYPLLNPDEQLAVRNVLRAALTSQGTPEDAAINANNSMWINASILRAYYCFTGEVTGTPSWETTLAVFHSGSGCLANGQICPAGSKYIDAVEH